jgi:hypothetical protein
LFNAFGFVTVVNARRKAQQHKGKNLQTAALAPLLTAGQS